MAPWFRSQGREARTSIWLLAQKPVRPSTALASHPEATTAPLLYPAQCTQPIEPILFPKLRIRFAEFPYATLFYAPETAHLGDLMRIRYGLSEVQRFLLTLC
jgi:hypothetical protein